MEKIQQNKMPRHNQTVFSYFMLGFIACAVVAFLWLPFGFSLTGLIEEWGVLGFFDNNGPTFVVGANSSWASQATRPLTIFPHAIAYYLDPNSFYYWHILLILALIIKSASAGQLIWKTTNSLSMGMVMAVLVVLYPADTMQLSFRALHINVSLALLLLASSIFIVAYEKKGGLLNYMLIMLAAILLGAAICMYEAALLLAPLPILLIVAKNGLLNFIKQLRAKITALLLWFSTPALYAGYFLWVSSQVVSYQSRLVDGHLSSLLNSSLKKLFKIGVLRSLVGGWFDAIRMALTEYAGYTYLLFATISVFVVIHYANKFNNKSTNNTNQPYLSFRLMLVGLLLLMLGYAPFLLSLSHLSISQRTFLFATPGAAIVCVSLLLFLRQLVSWLSLSIAACFIFLGFSAQLFQFHHYIKLGEQQRVILRSILENINIDAPHKTILIRDETNLIGHTWMLIAESMPYILGYFYNEKFSNVEICHMPSGEWQHRDSLARSGRCEESKNGWILKMPMAVSGPDMPLTTKADDIFLKKENVIAFTVRANGLVASSNGEVRRKKLQMDNTPVGLRYRNILAQPKWPLNLISFNDQIIPDYYKWSFGKWWSMELPVRGAGWREAEWKVNRLYHEASAWKTQGFSSLDFEFLPTKSSYILRGKFKDMVSDDIRNSTYVQINKTKIPLIWSADYNFNGIIPAHVMIAGLNRIEFNSKVDPTYFGLSSSLAWFEIEPV